MLEDRDRPTLHKIRNVLLHRTNKEFMGYKNKIAIKRNALHIISQDIYIMSYGIMTGQSHPDLDTVYRKGSANLDTSILNSSVEVTESTQVASAEPKGQLVTEGTTDKALVGQAATTAQTTPMKNNESQPGLLARS